MYPPTEFYDPHELARVDIFSTVVPERKGDRVAHSTEGPNTLSNRLMDPKGFCFCEIGRHVGHPAHTYMTRLLCS